MSRKVITQKESLEFLYSNHAKALAVKTRAGKLSGVRETEYGGKWAYITTEFDIANYVEIRESLCRHPDGRIRDAKRSSTGTLVFAAFIADYFGDVFPEIKERLKDHKLVLSSLDTPAERNAAKKLSLTVKPVRGKWLKAVCEFVDGARVGQKMFAA
jgi:hypothetical protein